MEIKFGKPAVLLAPMEGILDAPTRAVLTQLGGYSYVVSEFLRISQEVPPARTFLKHVPELNQSCQTPSGVTIQIQLLGGDPSKLAQAAALACHLGASAVDLNFGCPAPTVNRHDGGATLLKFPNRIFSIVKEVRSNMPSTCHLSAKLRLGWEDPESIYLNAEMAALGGASWITIHGRTRLDGYKPPAYWKPIGKVRKALGIPVIANGEIWTIDDFRRCRDETQCEHFMIGRGALVNPKLAFQMAEELGLRPMENISKEEPVQWAQIFENFANESIRYSYERKGYLPCRVKQWAGMIHRRSPLLWFDQIKTMSRFEEMMNVIANHRH